MTGLHCEVDGQEKTAMTTAVNKKFDIALIAEPEGSVFNPEEVEVSIIRIAGGTPIITVTHKEGELYEVDVPTLAVTGVYKITFTYKGYTTNFYLTV